MTVMDDINNVLNHYFPQNTIISMKEMAGGTVNKTYMVETEDKTVVILLFFC